MSMIHYYVVYCARTDAGTATGRTFVARNKKLDTADEIAVLEATVLENARKQEPSMSNLFLTFWAELSDSNLVPHPRSP